MNISEDTNNDYFDGPEIPDKPAEPKKPVYTPDDPRYWEQPEDEFEHLKPSRKGWRFWIWLAIAAVVLGILIGVYRRLFVARYVECTQYGYVESIKKSEGVFHTFEGVLLPYKNLMDTLRPYDGDFVFSVRDASVAAEMKRLQFANRPMRVEYAEYRSVMPWRGESKYLITKVDSVNERDILPPDRQPVKLKQDENDLHN